MSELHKVLLRVAKRIPAHVTPDTRIEIHPSEWIALVGRIEDLEVGAAPPSSNLKSQLEQAVDTYRLNAGHGPYTADAFRAGWHAAAAVYASAVETPPPRCRCIETDDGREAMSDRRLCPIHGPAVKGKPT